MSDESAPGSPPSAGAGAAHEVEIFPWSADFELGVELLDRQHKVLVDLLNTLAGHLAYQSDAPTLDEVLAELRRYTQVHFTDEDALWREHLGDDPWVLRHEAEHAEFVARLADFRVEAGQRSFDAVIEDMVRFLSRWLALHIIESDMRLVLVIQAMQARHDLPAAHQQAEERMTGTHRIVIDTVMGMVDKLATRAVQLSREIARRRDAEAGLRAANAELVRLRDEAERANAAKSDFLANMSHEIRTPLNGVLGLAQIGHRDSFGRSKAQSTFARILDSGKLLLTIVNDVLDLSKIEAGKLAVESVPLDPTQLLEQVLQGMAELASAKSLPLVADLQPLPRAVLGDPMRIAQILYNLLSNAVKFTERGEVRVRASTAAGISGATLVIAVSDTGIGIDPSNLLRLFQPFEQADGSHTRRFGGTGLGLAISRRLAGLLGGTIDVQSTLGKGSTFTLTLPLKPTERELPGHRVTGSGSNRRLAGLHLLVAEDNALNQVVIDELLRGEGAEVVLVDDGRQAVERASRSPRPFDAVLMDVQMPVMDGLEAAAALARTHPRLPVIGQTAHALKEETDRCRAAGMVATVQKPIDLELLVSTLLEHVRRNTVDGRPRAPMPEQAPVPSTPTTIDWVAFDRRYGGRRPFVERLAQLFVQRHAGYPDQLRATSGAEDYAAIEQLSHELKGSAGNVLAGRVENLAATTLDRARQRSRAALHDALALASELEEAIGALRAGPP